MGNSRNWRHTSYIGQACLAEKTMNAIIDADSVTPEAREIARRIRDDARKLSKELRAYRVEPNGTVKIFEEETQ